MEQGVDNDSRNFKLDGRGEELHGRLAGELFAASRVVATELRP